MAHSNINLKNPLARDQRLDFFRGIAFVIIFIAHSDGNRLWDYIPVRFGLSDATELFIFISGYAAAIAFGNGFIKAGFRAALARIGLRVGQLYLGHIFSLFGIVALTVWASSLIGIDYTTQLQIAPLLTKPASAIADIFALVYIPPYLDILPVYIVVMAMVPFVMLLAKIWDKLPILVAVILYVYNGLHPFPFPSNRESGAVWMLNPFAWQLLFFCGYSVSLQWLRVPDQRHLRIVLICISIIIVALGLGFRLSERGSLPFFAPESDMLRAMIAHYQSKNLLDPLRLLHFFATAWLVYSVFSQGRQKILSAWWGRLFAHLGQQGLVVFLVGMFLSHISGMVFDVFGHQILMQILVNSAAFAILYYAASLAGWIKSKPWKIAKH